jgi:hypothetical protein
VSTRLLYVNAAPTKFLYRFVPFEFYNHICRQLMQLLEISAKIGLTVEGDRDEVK